MQIPKIWTEGHRLFPGVGMLDAVGRGCAMGSRDVLPLTYYHGFQKNGCSLRVVRTLDDMQTECYIIERPCVSLCVTLDRPDSSRKERWVLVRNRISAM